MRRWTGFVGGWSLARSEDRNGVGSRSHEHENDPARQVVEVDRGNGGLPNGSGAIVMAGYQMGREPAASKMAAVRSKVSVEIQRGRNEAAADAVSPPARLKPSKMGKIRLA